ncbi:MAG: cyanophycinase [Calditrichia bacterium]
MKKVVVCWLLWAIALFAQGSLCLMGGRGESDDAMQWFVSKAQGGKIINIDVDEAAQGYADEFISLGADGASHPLQIPDHASANDSAVYKELISAKGIFIEGGDQWDYIRVWKGTLVEDAIKYVFQQGGVIGGTSAGTAILGEVVFDARYGSAVSSETVYNPYDYHISFTDDFLDILPNVLTDTHFFKRGRVGRLATMLARRIKDFGNTDLLAIGVDEYTAFCIDENNIGKVLGDYSVLLMYADQSSSVICEPGRPLTFTNIHYVQLVHGAEFDIVSKSLINPGPRMNEVNPTWSQQTYNPIQINGSDEMAGQYGTYEVTRIYTNPSNAYYGDLRLVAAKDSLPNSIIIPKLYADSDYLMNRLIGGIYGVALHPGISVIYADQNTQSMVNEAGIFTADGSVMILDSRPVTHVGNSLYFSNVKGLVNARLHFLSDGEQYDLSGQSPLKLENLKPVPKHWGIMDIYPNPFNPGTTIYFSIAQMMNLQLIVYNMLGQQVYESNRSFYSIGNHTYKLHLEGLSSGNYVLELKTPFGSDYKKITLIR